MKKLEIENIRKAFKKRVVVENVSIRVEEGEIVGLLGPNGAGKTTTFLIILGLHKPDGGRIRLNDRDITQYPVYVRSRMGISFLPQEPSVFKGLTVRENILAIMEMFQNDGAEGIDRVLDEMGLLDLKNQKAQLLSGGERRRLEIARSLILSPDFLLLDEPFAGIDPIQIMELQEIIKTFRQKKLGIIITDHNVREILKITDRSYIINHGQVIFDGNSQDLLADSRVKKEYLGEEFRWN